MLTKLRKKAVRKTSPIKVPQIPKKIGQDK